MSKIKTTHFGYEEVPEDQKAHKVADVFHSVASDYDLMNDLMSLGIHRLWKRRTIELSGVCAGDTILDLAGGSGDLTHLFSDLIGPRGKIMLSDINASMLNVGRDRLLDAGITQQVDYIQADAEKIPFADNTFDCITIGFGLRNVTHKEAALASMHRVLKPGKCLLVLEFSKPTLPGLKPLYDAYSFSLLPALGKLISNDADSYRYLAESIRMHPDQNTLKSMILKAGFAQCEVHNLSGGIVAIHKATKSSPRGLTAGSI